MKTILFLSILLITACSDDKFRKVERLDGFRILGVFASASEVAAGGSSNLQLLISDTKGAGRTVSVTYEGCIDPGIGAGAPVTCAFDPNKISGSLSVNTGAGDLGAANLFTGLSSALAVTVPPTIFAGRSAREQANGVSYIVIFKATVDGLETTAFKRILASTRTIKNANPSISSLNLNGGAFAAKPIKDDAFSVSTDLPETYDVIQVDGASETILESYEVAWYVSSGEVDKPKAKATQSVKYKDDPPSDPLLIMAVLRDERGGLAYQRVLLP